MTSSTHSADQERLRVSRSPKVRCFKFFVICTDMEGHISSSTTVWLSFVFRSALVVFQTLLMVMLCVCPAVAGIAFTPPPQFPSPWSPLVGFIFPSRASRFGGKVNALEGSGNGSCSEVGGEKERGVCWWERSDHPVFVF